MKILEKIALTGLTALAIDSIIVPFFTDGKTTLHEYVGLPPRTDYKILGDITLMMVERAIWSFTTVAEIAYRQMIPKTSKEN